MIQLFSPVSTMQTQFPSSSSFAKMCLECLIRRFLMTTTTMFVLCVANFSHLCFYFTTTVWLV